MEARLSKLEGRVGVLDSRTSALDAKNASLDSRVSHLERLIRSERVKSTAEIANLRAQVESLLRLLQQQEGRNSNPVDLPEATVLSIQCLENLKDCRETDV